MSLPDPVTLAYNTVNKSLPRVSSGDNESTYRLEEPDGTVYDLTIGSETKRDGARRSYVKLARMAWVDNPAATGQSSKETTVVTCALQVPANVPIVEAALLGTTLAVFLQASGNLTRIAAGEN